jgi:uncharacterized protein YcbX
MPNVSRISITPVKGCLLQHPEVVFVDRDGVAENRRFFLVDGEGRRLRSSRTAWPVLVSAEYDALDERLALRFPDGVVVEGSALELGEEFPCNVDGSDVRVRVVEGRWNDQLSRLAGKPVRLVRPERGGVTLDAPVTLVSDGSLRRLSVEAAEQVDGRRFRMLFELAGCEPHEEDSWNGRLLRAGEAVLRVGGPVPRCAVTTRDPETGERNLDTLKLVKSYRGVRDGEAIDFGVYAHVEQPGRVRVGDEVAVL